MDHRSLLPTTSYSHITSYFHSYLRITDLDTSALRNGNGIDRYSAGFRGTTLYERGQMNVRKLFYLYGTEKENCSKNKTASSRGRCINGSPDVSQALKHDC